MEIYKADVVVMDGDYDKHRRNVDPTGMIHDVRERKEKRSELVSPEMRQEPEEWL